MKVRAGVLIESDEPMIAFLTFMDEIGDEDSKFVLQALSPTQIIVSGPKLQHVEDLIRQRNENLAHVEGEDDEDEPAVAVADAGPASTARGRRASRGKRAR